MVGPMMRQLPLRREVWARRFRRLPYSDAILMNNMSKHFKIFTFDFVSNDNVKLIAILNTSVEIAVSSGNVPVRLS